MNNLTEIETQVITLRNSGLTLEEVSRQLNLTRTRIIQHEKSARQKLQK